MKHEQNTKRLSEVAYRLAKEQEIKSETIVDLTVEERTALEVLMENGSVETLCDERETSPMKGMWWLV